MYLAFDGLIGIHGAFQDVGKLHGTFSEYGVTMLTGLPRRELGTGNPAMAFP